MSTFFEITKEDVKIVLDKMNISISDEEVNDLFDDIDINLESELKNVTDLNDQIEIVHALIEKSIVESFQY